MTPRVPRDPTRDRFFGREEWEGSCVKVGLQITKHLSACESGIVDKIFSIVPFLRALRMDLASPVHSRRADSADCYLNYFLMDTVYTYYFEK